MPCVLLTLAVLPTEGRADNRLEVLQVGSEFYRIEARLTDYTVADGSATADLPGAERVEDPASPLGPAFVKILELPAGRAATVQSLSLTSRTQHWTSAASPLPAAPVDPLSVELAMMGRRVFLRIAFHPFGPGADAQTLTVHESVEALVRIETEAPPAARAAKSSSSGAAYPFNQDGVPRVALGVPDSGGAPSDFAARRSVTNPVAWRIPIVQPGLYRLSGSALQAAGVPAEDRSADRLRLHVRDQTVPVWFSTTGALATNDWLMFYGAGVNSQSTTQNIYWLSVGTPSPTPEVVSVAVSGGVAVVTSSWEVVRHAPRTLYRPSYRPLFDDFDHWFAADVQGGSNSTFALATPSPIKTGSLHLAYSVHGVNNQGSVNPDHRSVWRVGGTSIYTNTYEGEQWVTGTSSAPALLLNEATTVALHQVLLAGVTPADFGRAYLESCRLYYERALVANTSAFYWSRAATTVSLRVSGVVTGAFRLLDVTDPTQPAELQGHQITTNGVTRVVTFTDSRGGVRWYALLPEHSARYLPAPTLVRFRGIAQTNRQADYLAVACEEFRAPVYRLLKHRYKSGLSVQIASPQEVYDEFGYGIADAAAIRQYFGFAWHHYEEPPGYALLVGTGSYDPLNSLGLGERDRIPVRLGASPQRRTAFEQWFATVNGSDLLPDLAVGRITATNVTDVVRSVGKVVAFETAATNAGWRGRALLVADNTDGSNFFKQHAETNTRMHLEAGGFDDFSIATAYLDDFSAVQCRLNITGELNGGIQLMHYMGHGSVGQWASENVWDRPTALAATNTVYPIVSVFSCQVGAFHEPGSPCLADAILLSPAAGSACVAPTALSVQTYAERIADGFHEALAVDRVPRLGDALQAGLLRLWSFNPNVAELRTYALFGDPAQLIWGGAPP